MSTAPLPTYEDASIAINDYKRPGPTWWVHFVAGVMWERARRARKKDKR